MRIACSLAAAAALAAGCSSATAVDVTLTLAGDVAGHAAELRKLDLHVDGDQAPFDKQLDISGKFASGRETLEYLPRTSSGTLAFDVVLSDATHALGRGGGSVTLAAHRHVPLELRIGSDLDMGGGGGAGDMTMPSHPPDMTAACAAIQVSTLAGTGAAGWIDGPGNMARFSGAEGITSDSAGTLYVAEAAHLRKVLSDGTTSTISGSTVYLQGHRVTCNVLQECYVADSGNDCLWQVKNGTSTRFLNQGAVSVVADSPFSTPTEYIWDTQDAFIQVTNALNNGFDRFTGGGGRGYLDGPANLAQFAFVTDMIWDSDKVLWVTDRDNLRIRRVASDGTVSTLAGSDQQMRVDGTGAAASFDQLNGITVDNQQHLLYVTDRATVRRVTMSGEVTTIVGSTPNFVDGNGCVARFQGLQGITYFAGSLFVVDVGRIRKITLP
jgi:hypothetical protein